MKVRIIKNASGKLWPADYVSEVKINKLATGDEYEININTKQNGKLHRKIFGFFQFCTIHYYGDIEASKDEYKLNYVRNKLTVIAGYYRQIWSRDGTAFELVPLSLSYDKMEPDERGDFYVRITKAALKRVFDRTTDEEIINELLGWF